MGICLNPDNLSFTEALRSEIYVDKTGLLMYTNRVLGTEQKYICISRPRRFGKTMAAEMLAAYYSCGCDSGELFRGLSVLAYNNENALSCVISLAYYSAKNYYDLIREMPAGKGFADIVFLPKKKYLADKPVLLVELKWDMSAEGAVRQIKDRGYVKALEGYEGKILLVGIQYDRKNKSHACAIEEYQVYGAEQ